MSLPPIPPTASTETPAKPRSLFVTVLAWLMMVIGLIGLPISFISGLMVAAHSYGTNTSDPVGFITVVLGPPILLATGFGLLRRWRWALVSNAIILVFIVLTHAGQIIQGPLKARTFVDAAGVQTTVAGSGTNLYSVPIILLCVGVLIKLASPHVRHEFARTACPTPPPTPAGVSAQAAPQGDHRTWRVGHRGRDMMYYEEKVGGKWEHLDIDGEMLMGRAHHVIYFADAEHWQTYPEWARRRRAEIIARIKSEFHAPDYEYQGDA